MTWLRVFVSRLLSLFRSRRLEERVDEEVRFHLEMEVAEKNEISHRGIAIRKFVEEMPGLTEPGGQ